MFKSVLFITLLTLLPNANAQRYALVIGNSHYSSDIGVLKNPVNDAVDMAALLKKKKFKVTLIKNASKRQMKEGIRSFTSQLSQKDAVGLFFFAGHGVEVDGRNYLIPVNANIRSEVDVEYESIDAGRVMKFMQYAGNNMNMVILDACRNNPYARQFRSTNRGLTRMDPPKGSLILYATSPGEVASDGVGRNGLFTKYLLQAIDTPDVTVEKVFKTTANKVYRATAKKQLPWQSGVILGDFYFSESAIDKSVSKTFAYPVEAENKQAEVVFWTSMRNESNADYFKSYLQQYPNGLYAGLAKIKLNQIGVMSAASSQQAHLTLNTSPDDARIRILNISKKYRPGIQLKPGRYHIEVSKPGYYRHTEWLVLAAEDKVYSVVLQEKNASTKKGTQQKRILPSMVDISTGCYQMGSSERETDRDDDERLHKVCIDSFQLGKNEVTVGEFKQFVHATAYRTQAEKNVNEKGCYAYRPNEKKWAWRAGSNWKAAARSDQQPVVCISWYDAHRYISWLNKNSAGGYRLPTEAEWEYAARAGTQTAYFWGDKEDSSACRYANVADKVHNWGKYFFCDDHAQLRNVVGSYLANAYGLYDMSGNVWEWTCSQYAENYAGREVRCLSKSIASDTDELVLRGGSFDSEPSRLRLAYRSKNIPWVRFDYVGFRLARTR